VFLLALAVFIGVSVFVPLLQWLLPNNPLVAALGAVSSAGAAWIGGHELWDRLWAGRRRPMPPPAVPTSRERYLDNLIERLRVEEDQYVPLAGEQAPYEGYSADYSADVQTAMLQEYQDIGEALADEEHRRFVIIGDPGAGKTTTLRMLALAAARAQAGGERTAAIRELYGEDRPVPLPLWVDLGRTGNPPDAAQLLRTWWSEHEKLGGSVTDAMRNGQVWLFLDGLNEMPEEAASPEERARSLRDLFARNEFRGARLLVTCRERDYAGDLRLGLPVVRVRPLDDPRIEEFARYRLGSDAAGFLRALDAQPHLRGLGRNPYTLVRLISVYNEREPLPETLEALHKRHTTIRYAHEKEHGRVTVKLPRLEKRLERLAFRMIAAKKGTSADEAWAQRLIGRSALDDGIQLNLLVAEGRTGNVRFYHQTLHQYFALPGLTQRLAQGSAARRTRFIRQIGDLGEGGAPAVPALIKASQAPDGRVMGAALVALSWIDSAVFRVTWEQHWNVMPDMPPKKRAQWARSIADVDSRPGVGLRQDGLPDIAWLPVEGVERYQLLTDGGDKGTYSITPFYIAQYPITFVQFQAFVDAKDGFHNPAWWDGLGAGAGDNSAPGKQAFKYANHPRERVSWWDAVAFCRWMTAKAEEHPALLPALAKVDGATSGEGWVIRLPTEWEWQWAAQGSDGREYPYEGSFDAGKGNTHETGIGQTSAVGIFPQGASPYGALDMSGNVWEWCLNEYSEPERVGLEGTASRVVRGGSWCYFVDVARAVYRSSLGPSSRYYDRGFRVVAGAVPV
jgi:formylglycine-generating enzyme required for sulfatase activity